MAHAYTELKLAWGLFEKAPDALADTEKQRLLQVAERQAQIERQVLATREAAGVIVPDHAMANALAGIRSRYDSDDDFQADLLRLGLDESELNAALRRELREETGLLVTPPFQFLFVQEGERAHQGVRRYVWRSFFFGCSADVILG